ncbi:MAG: ComEC/Rec2 family competence protein [Candidatus Paceibacterota bacterium]|jgi:beta-lactamase superfamily II metal-dependent hydrolase
MVQNSKKYLLLILVLILLVGNFFIYKTIWENSHRQFTFAVLDVGQGDAIFIESPTGTQLLIDSGPPRKILGALQKVMSPFDRSIDAIIITHPDADHIGGFTDVLKNYKVGRVFDPGIISDSKTYQNLENEIQNQKIPNLLARKGMKLDLGGGAILEILFPDQDVSNWETNEGSVVAKLIYGNNSFLLTGDSPTKIERKIIAENSAEVLKSDILKLGHHGSRTSSSFEFLQAVSPRYALISVGLDNRYNHPHQEVLDLLNKFGIKIFRTDLQGTILLKSDGQNLIFNN